MQIIKVNCVRNENRKYLLLSQQIIYFKNKITQNAYWSEIVGVELSGVELWEWNCPVIRDHRAMLVVASARKKI